MELAPSGYSSVFRRVEFGEMERWFESFQGDQPAAADTTPAAQKRGILTWGKSPIINPTIASR
ncbi:hypothetical protein SAMN05216228_102880 [Rhizobium tibeticum]|uniref:Uncharacterized protein n=1 Tax=Rhizobium tibeticum TaxID=501024 RepID=A0A1H8TFU2_9HYPH|nr:hypothetical protein RTCCBAU85039_5180 [Rhizobium tibeticum]SEO89474.1 hypothetical protein SAMN05216228_102880 [Rhizobium tibeticum]